jgi:hypothetical protein
MDHSSLRQQPTERLEDTYSHVRELLSHSELLPAELHIKLDTFYADLTAILEDRGILMPGN